MHSSTFLRRLLNGQAIAVLAACAVCAAVSASGCSSQISTQNRITEAGGRVEMEETAVRGIDLSNTKEIDRTLRGLPDLETVQDFAARETSLNDEMVQSLPNWPLQRMDLRGTKISSDSLERIAEFTQLRWLSLADTNVAGDLSSLHSLKELRTLALPLQAGNETLASVASWPQLETLFASHTSVRGDGLSKLTPATAPKLKTLYLAHTAIEDLDMRRLPRLPQLERIILRATSVGDQTAEHLAQFPSLDYLDFSETRLTDAGLRTLAALPSLYVLDLDGSNVTLEGLQQAVKSHPQLRISHRLLTPVEPEDEFDWRTTKAPELQTT